MYYILWQILIIFKDNFSICEEHIFKKLFIVDIFKIIAEGIYYSFFGVFISKA